MPWCVLGMIFHKLLVLLVGAWINLKKGHWQAVKWILSYILGTIDVGLLV